MNLLFWRKPKKCPSCGMPYQSFANVHEWYVGGWVSGTDVKVPLVGHATYENGQHLEYEFPWEDIYEKYGEEAFNINLGWMPTQIKKCGCSTLWEK